MKKYKVGIVGCGGIGHAHMEGYKKLDNVEVIACCDKIQAAVETYQKEFGIPQGFTDLDKMLSIAKPVHTKPEKNKGKRISQLLLLFFSPFFGHNTRTEHEKKH